jgi:hypothetical protein
MGEKNSFKQLYVTPLRTASKAWAVVEIADAGPFDFTAKRMFREAIVKWVGKQGRR